MSFDWISFDCHGTLIDWDMGLRQFFKQLLLRRRVMIPAEQIIKAWQPIHLRMLQGTFRRYREILYESLDEALRECKISYTPEDGAAFAQAFGSWRPYGDVTKTLPRLQKMSKIAIIANCDREFILRSVSYLGIAPNLVTISEDVRSYKPSGKLFVAALAKMYAPSDKVLHVTSHERVDLEPAHRLGFKTCYLRRQATVKDVAPMPDYNVPSLHALASRLGAPAADAELPPWSTLDV